MTVIISAGVATTPNCIATVNKAILSVLPCASRRLTKNSSSKISTPQKIASAGEGRSSRFSTRLLQPQPQVEPLAFAEQHHSLLNCSAAQRIAKWQQPR